MSAKRAPEAQAPDPYGGLLRPRHHLRMRLVRWAFLLIYAVIALRLGYLQLHPNTRYSQEDLKHIGEIEIPIPRGAIYDSKGVALALDKTVYSLWTDPRRITDPAEVARRLAPALNVPVDALQARLEPMDARGNTRMFSWVRRWMADEEVKPLEDLIAELNRTYHAGLHLRPEPLRYYPQADLAAHVLGYAKLDRSGPPSGEAAEESQKRVGQAGIEWQYDSFLSSKPGRRKSRKDAQRNLLSSLTLEYQEPQGGYDVHLTLDASTQYKLEQELDKALESAKAPRGMGIVMDPDTGAILALACRPAFNPNRYWEYTDPVIFNNRAVQETFEPGSAFKIVAAAAALERNLITPDTPFDCENGGFSHYGRYIRDYHRLGVEPFRVCFAESSNVAIIKVGGLLGPNLLNEWIHRFGFGRRTSRDFMMESPGIVHPLEKWTRYSMGSLPMGQEISVTMPQLARAFAVIANGGYLVEPYLVECVVDRDGTYAYSHEPEPPVRILSEETARTMQELSSLVAEEGTGKRARIPEYRVGGKTGTAQIALPGRGYIPGKYTAIFAGFAPIADPRLVCVIVVQEPEIALHFGGWICGPVFKEVVRDALIRMNCPLDPEKDYQPPTGPARRNDADADTVTAHAPVLPSLDGTATGHELSPDDMLGSLDGLELVARTKDLSIEGPVLPDFTGLTKSQAMARVAALGLGWDAHGTGWVTSQSPPPGTPLSQVSLCQLVFSNERTADNID